MGLSARYRPVGPLSSVPRGRQAPDASSVSVTPGPALAPLICATWAGSCMLPKAPPGSLWCLLLEGAGNLIDLRAKRNDHHWVYVWNGGGGGVGRAIFVFLLLLEITTVVHLP